MEGGALGSNNLDVVVLGSAAGGGSPPVERAGWEVAYDGMELTL